MSGNSSSANPPFMTTLDIFKQRISSSELSYDPSQERAATRLSRLQLALIEYDHHRSRLSIQPAPSPPPPSTQRLSSSSTPSSPPTTSPPPPPPPPTQPPIPRGLYLHGPVGTGKSLLMDTFHTTTPLPPSHKKRYHFHAFMHLIHSQIHQLKKHDLETSGRNFHVDTSDVNNPIIRVAFAFARDTTILCLDECQVIDVADAMILRQFFETLWRNGVVTIMTSNVAPEGLYEGGVNYGYFMPFVELLRRYCVVYDVANGEDYRRRGASGDFFFSLEEGDDRGRVLEWCRGQRGESSVVNLGGNRQLTVPRSIPSLSMAWVTFEDLCEKERGAGDYRRLAAQFRVLVLEHVPLLTLQEHDRARRFITLIDELYEARCCLMLRVKENDAARVILHPDDLFADDNEGDDVEDKKEGGVDDVVDGILLGVDVAQVRGLAVGELASVRELRFAFRRAASRLWEMCSRNWWNKDDAGRTILERLDNNDRL